NALVLEQRRQLDQLAAGRDRGVLIRALSVHVDQQPPRAIVRPARVPLRELLQVRQSKFRLIEPAIAEGKRVEHLTVLRLKPVSLFERGQRARKILLFDEPLAEGQVVRQRGRMLRTMAQLVERFARIEKRDVEIAQVRRLDGEEVDPWT